VGCTALMTASGSEHLPERASEIAAAGN
jgi:hypothetical protein